MDKKLHELMEEKQRELTAHFEEYIDFSLKKIHEEFAEKVLSTVVRKGLPVAAIIEALANLTDQDDRYTKTTRLLELAVESIELADESMRQDVMKNDTE